MGDLLIRNVPEPMKLAIERAARRDGRSLSATAIDLLQKSLADSAAEQERPVSAWSELRSLLQEGSEDEAEEFARIMEEIEAARKNDFGRPLPEFDE
ncbi:plasmid stabilization protein [Aquibium sp. LZ166]|uniref:Plasmid stabilization protein n=1 Tax=Aquibium pacificus TaxID=3153579 RepID=A0ABV3SLE8_9HYPH